MKPKLQYGIALIGKFCVIMLVEQMKLADELIAFTFFIRLIGEHFRL